MDDELRQRYEAMARDAGEDELLRHMFETMSAAPKTPPGMQESYDRQMNDIHERYPNQWILYRDTWDTEAGVVTVDVLGPFPTLQQAMERGDALRATERSSYTVYFTECLPPDVVRMSHRVTIG